MVEHLEIPAHMHTEQSAFSGLDIMTLHTQSGAQKDTAADSPAMKKLDHLNLADKAALSPEQSDTLRKMESGILKGDLKSVEDTLHKFKDNPEALKPMMDVLSKDLQQVGLRATYDVDKPMTDKGDAQPSGMFGLTTSMGPDDYFHKNTTEMCMYTNPASSSWAEHDTPAPDRSSSPSFEKVSAASAFKEMGDLASRHL
jgi:hypothetical protein